MQKTDIAVEEDPELRYTKSGLPICTLRMDGAHYVAFDKAAEEIAEEVPVGDILRLTGYYKAYMWKNSYGDEQSRDDFIIKSWERIG